jgi:hypothetical protein
VSNTPPSSKHHIVIAGGCHVNGWPIGGASSFVRVMLQSNPYAVPATIAPINLRNCSSLLGHLKQHSTDAVILQFGNYETLASVKKHIRAVLHLGRQPHHSENDSDGQLNPDTVFPSTPGWRIRVLSKQIYSYSLGRIHPPLFDAKAFRRHSEKLLADLAQLEACAPKLIVFLSPIPCADSLIRHYRCQAARILSDLCSNAPADLPFRLRFLDTTQALGIGPRTAGALNAGVFADDLHLNGKGHQLLGNALARFLRDDPCLAPHEESVDQLQHL